MAKNTFRKPERVVPERVIKRKRERRKLRLAAWLNDLIPLDRLFGEDNAWPIHHIDRILWVTFLLILYIGLNHNAERLFRRILRTKAQVSELRAQATVLQADFDKSGKQSEISRRVAPLGLINSQPDSIYKIIVKSHEEPK